MIEYSENFLKEAKQLSKKFKQLKSDLKKAVKEIEDFEDLGVSLGHNLFKKGVPNSSIPTGKSGGFRIIIYKKVEEKIVLISIYSKSYIDTLSDDELKSTLNNYLNNQ